MTCEVLLSVSFQSVWFVHSSTGNSCSDLLGRGMWSSLSERVGSGPAAIVGGVCAKITCFGTTDGFFVEVLMTFPSKTQGRIDEMELGRKRERERPLVSQAGVFACFFFDVC